MASKIFESLGKLFGVGRPAADSPASAGQRLVAEGGADFVVEEVRRGGMGIVYLCSFGSDAPDHEHRVALKTFDDRHYFDPAMADTFRREHSLWTLVADVPFVLPVLGVYTIAKKPHLAMVAADGDGQGNLSLREAIHKSPGGLQPEAYLPAAFCVAVALKGASQRVPGLVHGDIKPDNVLYVAGKPFLSDFGLAGFARRTGRRGTPPYMAPELWTADGKQTPASDVYAYGVMLAELLTGTLPLNAAKDDLSRWSHVHAEEAPRIDLDPDRSDLECATLLRALALRCLAKTPEARPADFATVASECSAAAWIHDPVLALGLMTATRGLMQVEGSERNRLLELRLKDLLRNQDIEAAIMLLKQVPEEDLCGELLLAAGSAWSLAGDDEKALEYFERFLSGNPAPDRRWACLNEIGLSLTRLRRLDQAKELYEKLLVEAVGNDDLDLMVRSNYAGALIENKQPERAITELRRVLAKNGNSPTPLALLARALQHAGHHEEAAKTINRAIAADPRNGNYHVLRADILLHLGQMQDALESVDRAYSLGFHSRQWLVLALAVNIALDRKEEVEGFSPRRVTNCRATRPMRRCAKPWTCFAHS